MSKSGGENVAPEFRAGFVSFVGRPNVGKSTLMNALVGEKVAITSPQPQTTRRAIRGIVHRSHGQVIIVDTPGMHKPRTTLGTRLNDLVAHVLSDVDVVGFCVPASESIGPGDRRIVEGLERMAPRARRIAIVTKTDTTRVDTIAAKLHELSLMREWDAIIPVSSQTGEQLEVLVNELIALMPSSPRLYESETTTDEPQEIRVAEYIREAALDGVREELPHSIAVTIDEMMKRPDKDLIDIYASLFVERDSQKSIIIGKGGERLRATGSRARAHIEALLGSPVYLSLKVRVAKDWQRDPKQLRRLGFDSEV